MTDENESYPDDLWQLVLSRRELLELLPDVDQDTRENLRRIVENLELISLAAAWGLPEAVAGHAAHLRVDPGKQAQAPAPGPLRRWLRNRSCTP